MHPRFIKKLSTRNGKVICVKGAAGGKTVAKVLRSDAKGNLHLLILSGTSAQEPRIVTAVGSFPAGESLRRELNEMLAEAMGW